MTDIKVGDEVRVFYGDGRERRNRPDDGYPGEVVKVGRTLATIRYQGHEAQFRRHRTSQRPARQHFMTPAQVEAGNRKKAALALLREAGFDVRLGHHPDAELIERLAAATLDWAAEQTARKHAKD